MGVAVGEGEAVGVCVAVAKVVDVGVAVGMPPPLALLASNEMTVTSEMKPIDDKTIPSRRSMRSLSASNHDRTGRDVVGSASMVVFMPEGAAPSSLTMVAKGSPNMAWYISATFWKR